MTLGNIKDLLAGLLCFSVGEAVIYMFANLIICVCIVYIEFQKSEHSIHMGHYKHKGMGSLVELEG